MSLRTTFTRVSATRTPQSPTPPSPTRSNGCGDSGSAWTRPRWRRPNDASPNRRLGPRVKRTDRSAATTIVFPEFTLRGASAEDWLGSSQEWTRGESKTDNNHAGWYELRCDQTLLRRIHYVSFDDKKKSIVAPDWRPIGQGRFYFYQANSVRYAVQRFWAARHDRDDSKGLRLREGESATEARSRWRRGLDIPVLSPGELEGFLKGREGNAIGANNPATDRAEQYELFLHNLLDFDDWRRAQRA